MDLRGDNVLDPGGNSFGYQGCVFWIQGDSVLDPGELGF